MAIRCTITAAGVTNEYGQALAIGTVYTPFNDDYALSLIAQGKATDTDSSLVNPGVSDAQPVDVIYCNAAALAAPTAQMLRSYNVQFALDVSPFTRYISNGSALIPLTAFTYGLNGTANGLLLPGGSTLLFGGALGQQNTEVTAPVDTNKNVLYTLVIPANTLLANDSLRVTHNWECTNNANPKTTVFDWNGGAAASFSTTALTNSASQRGIWTLSNRNSLAAQVGDASLGFIGAGTTSPTSTIDFAVQQTFTIALTKATGADAVKLTRVVVELIRGV